MVEVHKDVSFKHPFWFECLRVFVQVLVVAGFWVWVLGPGSGSGFGSWVWVWVLGSFQPTARSFFNFSGSGGNFQVPHGFFKNKNRKLLRSMI